MDLSSSQVESIVRQVLSEMNGTASSSSAAANIPATAKVATLVEPHNIVVKEYPMPTVGDNDILVNVDCRDYWWDDIRDTLVIITGTTSFYQRSRISQFTERKLHE